MAELKKTLGMGTIIALTLTSLVGTGMFLGTSVGAAYSGNGVIIAWALLLALSLYVSACFGELIALFPSAGGVYEFSKQAYGRFISFIVGWVSWLMATIATPVLIIAALGYLLPPEVGVIPRMAIAIAVIIVLNIVAFMGVDTSAAVLMVFAVETVLLFLSIIIPGFLKIDYANFTPFMSGSWPMLFVALFFMLESLMGWEAASFLAEETKDAERVIPKALMITTIVTGLFGLLIAVVSLGVIPWHLLVNSSAPVTDVARVVLGATGARIIAMGVVLALLGSVMGVVTSTPRLLLAMARDKVFISQLAAIHPKRRTPHNAIIFQAVVSILIIIIGFGQYKVLLAMFTPLALIMYISVLLAVPIMRRRMPDAKRSFKVIFGNIGPVLLSLLYLGVICVWLTTDPSAVTIFRIIISLVFFGVPIYLLMIFFYNPDAISGFSNRFAYLSLWLENILLPRHIRREIINLFKDLNEKSVLEYGSGVGTLTLQLAEAVGPLGRVYASDLSKKNIYLLKKRMDKRGLKQVTPIHDEHQVNRVHPSVLNVDAIFSVGFMSYMQDIKKILKEMHRILPESGRICFVEYVNFFKILPDKEWLSDEENLRKTFREAGFSVKVERKRGFLWNYMFIYGIKSEHDVPVI
ncbi:MAG: amino acid permease [archaeon]